MESLTRGPGRTRNGSSGPALFAAFLLLLMPGPRASYAAFEDLGFGARAPGMGDAFSAVADDVSSIYYNPAGLAGIERPKALASHSMFYSGLSDGSSLGLSAAAFAVPLSGGRKGALGALWQQFSLSGVYYERTAQISWGYRFDKRSVYKNLSVGASLKYLNHGFSRLEETYNAVENDIMQRGGTDPVLAGENSASAIDADLGVLYRLTKNWTLGAAVLNAMQADVAFSGDATDKVPRKTRVGASFKSLWLILTGEARLQKSPDGRIDQQLIFAAEKVFPSLDKGDVSARASLGAGDREFRQATAGLSYKIQKIQLDYGFSLPIGTVKETAGNHKLALTYHFGSPTQAELSQAQLLDQYRSLREVKDYKSQRLAASLGDPRLAEVKEQVDKENYYAANRMLLETAHDLLPDASVVDLTRRLSTVAAFYPAIPGEDRKRERWEELLGGGVKDLVNGADQRAMKLLAYAQSLNQQDAALSNFLERAGELTRVTPDRVPSHFTRGWAEFKIYESDELYAAKRYPEALRRLEELLEVTPGDPAALKKSGSCNYMLRNYAKAVYYWEKAADLETSETEKAKLYKRIEQARQKQGTAAVWRPAAPVAPEPAELPAPAKDSREIEKMYQTGVDYYAKGEYAKAEKVFRDILELDPKNGQAKKALERIVRLSR